jgi:hypothetical protein
MLPAAWHLQDRAIRGQHSATASEAASAPILIRLAGAEESEPEINWTASANQLG